MKFSRLVSKQPRKKRKALYLTALHSARRLLHSNVSDELRKKIKRRSVLVARGDRVKVMRGSSRNTTGKVIEVDYKRRMVFVEGVSSEGRKSKKRSPTPIDPSKLQVLEQAEKKVLRKDAKARGARPAERAGNESKVQKKAVTKEIEAAAEGAKPEGNKETGFKAEGAKAVVKITESAIAAPSQA